MDPFTRLTGIAAPLPLVNVDTDMIIPKQFLKTIKRTGLKSGLFYEMRWDEAGEKKDFILDTPDYADAQILIAGDNFGCGSSREHAPWALLDFGIRCVIAPSFADIFYNNCFNNGILPVRLPQDAVDRMTETAGRGRNATFTVDLARQVVIDPDGAETGFDIDPGLKHRLLNGLDQIGLTLEMADDIDGYEAGLAQDRPWLAKSA